MNKYFIIIDIDTRYLNINFYIKLILKYHIFLLRKQRNHKQRSKDLGQQRKK